MPAADTFDNTLQDCMVADRYNIDKLHRTIAARREQGKPCDRLQSQLDAQLANSQEYVARRRAALPTIQFPENLPVSAKRDVIADAIDQHQVVIVAGETGSGKTTQLPKICLQMGRGVTGMIGHTQPRRIAARTVADRIAEELSVPLGESVGYQVRFTDHSSPQTHIKLMTDGILLAEIQNDRYLRRYDTLIIDEAHERSLNIDFLLGYLKRLLPKRPDLKVIITSATIDVERLSKHFDEAPVVQVSGRTYPVDIHYRPLADEDEALSGVLVNLVDEILAGHYEKPGDKPGDILVFLSGERDIRETALALRRAQFSQLEILPLYARLSLAEQNRVFQSHRGVRVVLATNVAETSLTVPGIRYVIDPGTARVSRYSFRTKVQRLPIEAISQASANQRAGRSGRVAPGVCFRLYEEADFHNRPEFNDPEVLRSNLASVILQMAQLGLGDIRQFPFVDQPDSRLVNDGYKLLEELQAIDKQGKLTPLGRQLSQFSVDPRFARMCLAAKQQGCLREVLIIISALTIQDPRERPGDKQQAADQQHRRFWHEHSDFLAYINLWHYAETQRQALTQNQFRRQCKKEFLSFLRLREWRDLHHQLRLTAKHLGWRENQEPAEYEAIHRALLTGLLGNAGQLDEERQYLGPRNRRFAIFPGSSQFKKLPKWLVAGELVETGKLYAHCVAKVEPEWLLAAAEHLVKRHHFEPYYDSRRGQVMAFERVTLYGLVLVEKRRVNFSTLDPVKAREIFIQSALVEGHYLTKQPADKIPAFWRHNQALYNELQELEAKSRRRDILAEDRAVFEFFDERIPTNIVNRKGFEKWRQQAEAEQPELLFIPRHLLMQQAVTDITEAQFPNELQWEDMQFRLSYRFEPGHPADGVTVHLPVHSLHLLPPNRLQWLVPGMLREKCVQLVKGLPKQWRKHFVPVPDYVDRALAQMTVCDRPLVDCLGEALAKLTNSRVPAEVWDAVTVDSYYEFTVAVEDEQGKLLDSGRDLQQLRDRYRDRLQETLRTVGESIEREGLNRWDFEELPETHQLQQGKLTTLAYPTLVDRGDSVALQLMDNPQQAQTSLARGLTRLVLLELNPTVKHLRKGLLKGKQESLRLAAFGSPELLADDLLCAAARHSAIEGYPLPRSKTAFAECRERATKGITPRARQLEQLVKLIAERLLAIHQLLAERADKPLFAAIAEDIRTQLERLIHPGFLFATPALWLDQYPRYLEAINARLAKTDAQIQKDLQNLATLQPWLDRLTPYWQGGVDQLPELLLPELIEYRWMLEEFRISLFAQPMKTRLPVSPKRLAKQWAAVDTALASQR